MKLGYDLILSQKQNLILTPELRQAIELLQFNCLELRERINRELEENPMLELSHKDTSEEVNWKEYTRRQTSFESGPSVGDEEDNLESVVKDNPTITEYLISQLGLLDLSDLDRYIGLNIIYSMEDSGYFLRETKDLAKDLGVSEEEVLKVLDLIQSFEPIGVCSRSLRECLLIQAREYDGIEDYVIDIIKNHLEDLANNRIQKISKDLSISIEETERAFDFIRSLEPRPGSFLRGNEREVEYIIPDAEIKDYEGRLIVVLNEPADTRLNINNFYKNLLETESDPETLEYLNSSLNRALWFIRAIEQRKTTIKKVLESIVNHQEDFFRKGEKWLKPLTLRQVAEDIDMHESTVSRVTSGKYVQTPMGIYELKFFFLSGLETSEGEVSSLNIKHRIKELILEEDEKKPISDQKIADILKEEGTSISRRTVAKYRLELDIPSSSMRRRF